MTSPSRSERRLYVLCGLPFAGKSTLARELAAHLGLVHLEVDQIHRDRGLGGDGRRLSRADWVAAYRESYRRLDALLADGCSVVYDATNFRRRMRDRLRQIADAHGAQTTVILVDPSEEEVRRRLARNRANPRRADVPDDDFREVVASFQPPGSDERVIRFDPSVPIGSWVERLWADDC